MRVSTFMAATNGMAEFEGGGDHRETSSEVQAAIVMCGPMNMLASGVKQFAKRPIDDGEVIRWGPDTKMHVASTTKIFMAMVLVLELEAQGVSLNTPIGPYLPVYWGADPSVESITFDEVLRHDSRLCNGGWRFASAKAQVAAGQSATPCVDGTGTLDPYRNVNYVLLRVLLGTVSGKVDTRFARGFLFESMSDLLWNLATMLYYRESVQTRVFDVAGVGRVPSGDIDDAAFRHIGLSLF